jgi:hypothetical protein
MKMKAVSSLIILIFSLSFQLSAQAKYKLVEKDAVASCFSFDIVDENNKQVKLPDKFKDVLDCPAMIDIHGSILTYEYNGVRQYNIDKGIDMLLFHNYDDIDGCSGPAWSEDGSKVMFVIINQQMKHDYKAMCRIIVLTLDENGSVLKKRKFDRNVHFFCGSICASIPGEDFYFKDQNTIVYREHNYNHEDFKTYEISLK